MVEPEKPFACPLPDCGKTFTNEDHLHVHTKKHDMYLQFGMEQKAGFVADQTPTPTRFIRNCEEVGLFQDLQNVTVNPFDEGFQRALETNSESRTVNLLEGDITPSSGNDDVLHTPQMVFPILDGDSTLFSRTNNQRNITISRSSSDESGAVKEYETTTISKLTNEVTTISRIVGKQDGDKIEEKDTNKDRINETVYRNNVIKIQSNVEIRKDNLVSSNPIYDSVIKDTSIVKDVLLTDTNRLQVPEIKIPPIMSQRSLDYVVDSLTSECQSLEKEKPQKKQEKVKENDDYEVIIKLPNGKHVRMKAVEDVTDARTSNEAKEKLKKVLTNKVEKQNQLNQIKNLHVTQPIIQNVLPITAGTLIPVTLVNPVANIPKLPLPVLHTNIKTNFKTVKRKATDKKERTSVLSDSDSNECVVVDDASNSRRKTSVPKDREDLNRRSAAARRYRGRLKETMIKQKEENRQLKEMNQRLVSEKAVLQLIITEHLKKCAQADELKKLIESANDKLKQT